MQRIYPKLTPNYILPQNLETASKCLNCTVSAKKKHRQRLWGAKGASEIMRLIFKVTEIRFSDGFLPGYKVNHLPRTKSALLSSGSGWLPTSLASALQAMASLNY